MFVLQCFQRLTCTLPWLQFNVSSCNFDNEECLKCSWEDEGRDCDPSWIADGFCDWDCHTANCDYDGGDCPALITPSRAVELAAADACPALPEFLGDGEPFLEVQALAQVDNV